MSNENSIIIYIELTDTGSIMPVSLECVSMGRKLAGILNVKLSAFVAGSGIDNIAEELRHYNLDNIYTADKPIFKHYQPDCYVAAFESLCKDIKPKAILMGNSLRSIDLAPRIAFRLNTGLITDCVGIENSDELEFIKPVYSGNVMAAFTMKSAPYMATIRTRSVDPAPRTDETKGEILPVNIEIDESIARTETIKIVLEEDDGPKLESADIVVAGGRGIGGAEGFKELSLLANMLNGALGASRPPCDLGWVHPKAQVGQTGVIVGPSIYIAVGISGSTQHIAGISASKVIIAINKDPDANIFRMADYGVVGKYEEILPAFRDTLKEISK